MEDTQEDGDDLLSVVVKEEYGVQEAEEEVQFVKQEIRMVEIPSLDCHECGETHKNVQCLLRHLASPHGGLVTEISDSLSTTNLHSVTSIKEEQTDEVEEFSDLKIPFGSAMSIETPLPGSKNFECDKCGMKLMYKRGFIRHYREIHLGYRKFKCNICKKIYKRNSALKKHLKSHSEKLHSCEMCGKAYKRPMDLKRHIKTHAAVEKFKCEKCGAKLTYKHGLIRHFKEVHLGYRNFECKKCKKIFTRKHDLQIHLKNHSINSLECHECGRSYRNVQSLLGHLASSHGRFVSDSFSTSTSHSITSAKKDQIDQVERSPNLKITSESTESIFKILPKGSKKFECNKCGLKVMHKQNIIRHYKEVHLGMKNFKCEQCEKVFSRHSDLKIHLELHSNKPLSVTSPKEHQKDQVESSPNILSESPTSIFKILRKGSKKFECLKCGLKVMHRQNITRHYKEVHLGMKNFKCRQCNKIFSRHSHLKKHLKIHSKKSLSVTMSKEHQKDQVKKFPDMELPAGSEIGIKTPLPRRKKFECDECGVKLTYKRGFIRHYREVHLGTRTHKCEQCKKVFTRHSHLKKHLMIHSKQSLSLTRPKEHQKDQVEKFPDIKVPPASETSIKKLECDKYGEKSAPKFRRHYKEIHLAKKTYECKQCNIIFKRKFDLQIHIEGHSNNSLECHECGRSYRNVQYLSAHLASSHGCIVTEISDSPSTSTSHSVTSVKKEQIDQVESSPNILSESPTSIFKILRKGSKKFECLKCGLKLMHRHNITRHYKEVHLEMKNFKCEQCEKVFTRHSHLKKHLKIHSKKSLSVTRPKEHQKDQVIKCPDMEIPPGPEIGIKTPLPGCKKFECDECEVKFAHQGSFSRHYREVHLGTRTYKCEKCEKVFSRHSHLKRHLKSHSNIKLLKCHECGRICRNVQGLLGHLASRHSILVTEI